MSGTHSLLSPSKLPAIVRCVGMLAACKGEPEQPSSEDAASGTCTHWISQQCLQDGDEPERCVGKTLEFDGFKFKIDSERCDRVHTYIEAIRREPGEKLIEVRLDTSELLGVPGQSGTADAVTLDVERKMLGAHDLKDGAMIVYCEGNEQLITYAAAALRQYDWLCDWEFVKVAIHQPRMRHYDEHIYARTEIDEHMIRIRLAAQTSHALYVSGTPAEIAQNLTPGEKQCRWCAIRGKCPARAKAVLDLFPNVGDESEPEFAILDDDAIAAAFGRTAEIENWCRDIRSEALRRMLCGKPLAGYKIIQGRRGNRHWIDKVKAEDALQLMLTDAQLYEPREIVSPTTVERLLKTNYDAVRRFVSQNEGSLSIVPETHKGEAVTVSQVEFAAVGDAAEGLI